MGLVFTGAWAATIMMPSTELLVEMFTSAPPSSTEALAEGMLVAFLIGFVGAATALVVYRAIGLLERL